MARSPRTWTADQLRRMKVAVESGVLRETIALRFGCGGATVSTLAVKHGWKWPAYAGPGARRKGSMLKPPPLKEKRKRGSFFIRPATIPFIPTEGGCPVRVLQGAEFQHYKRIYEARERKAAQAQLRTDVTL